MEIDFNPNQVSPARLMNAVRRSGQGAAQAPDAVVSDPSVAKLQASLSTLPDVRADKVDQARAFLADPGYPPDYLFDRISTLLAIHLRP